MNLQLMAQTEEVMSASMETAGYLIAAGDSWFDYPWPFCDDILVQLHDRFGYNIESSAHHGDRIESMPYKGGQLDRFTRNLDKLHDQGIIPKAVLISGGGNDFAGDEFGMLLNSAASSIGGWNQEIVEGLIQLRLRSSYHAFLASINDLCSTILGKTIPILIHGYDYPVPDGRGFLGGAWILPGPWLKPGFDEKLFTDLTANTASMRVVIDQFNQMLAAVATAPDLQQVHYIDLRGTLSSVVAGNAYKKDWNNELHPEERGFIALATRFAQVLATL
jgi:GDSL-like Lipase/Acylhydrolase family